MKLMDFISNPLTWADTLGGRELVSMAVEFLFIDSEHQQQRSGKINCDLGYANSGLHSTAPKLKPKSGWYRDSAVPI